MEKFSIAKKIIPPNQLKVTLELMNGEEGDFYRNKITELEGIARRLLAMSCENTDDGGKHPLELHYYDSRSNSDWYVSELDNDGTVFGYAILGGDTMMAEWGYSNLNEIFTACPYAELDYHAEKMTIEEAVNRKTIEE